MKFLVVLAVIVGCLSYSDAGRIARDDSSGEAGAAATGNAFFGTGGNSGTIEEALFAAGETVGAAAGGADDAGGASLDTPDSPDSPDDGVGAAGGPVVAAGGDVENEIGDTPDDADSPGVNNAPLGGESILKNSGRGDSVDDKANPGQIVGTSSTAGTTAGIVVGVVALVGVAAGVAFYVIKKRN